MINYFSKYKFIFYLCNFILIVLYLFPGSLLGCYFYNDCKIQPQITANFIISTNHLYAYIILSVIGFLTFRKNNQFNSLSKYFAHNGSRMNMRNQLSLHSKIHSL